MRTKDTVERQMTISSVSAIIYTQLASCFSNHVPEASGGYKNLGARDLPFFMLSISYAAHSSPHKCKTFHAVFKTKMYLPYLCILYNHFNTN